MRSLPVFKSARSDRSEISGSFMDKVIAGPGLDP